MSGSGQHCWEWESLLPNTGFIINLMISLIMVKMMINLMMVKIMINLVINR